MSAYNFILSQLGTKRLFRPGEPTWRSSSRLGTKLGYDDKALKRINTESISFLKNLKTLNKTGSKVSERSEPAPRKKDTPNWMNQKNSIAAILSNLVKKVQNWQKFYRT